MVDGGGRVTSLDHWPGVVVVAVGVVVENGGMVTSLGWPGVVVVAVGVVVENSRTMQTAKTLS